MQLGSFVRAAGWRRTIGLIGLLVAALFAERILGTADVTEVTGHPRLVDGDSFTLNGHKVRMVGIDAPEGQQMCQRQGKDWPCGREATTALSRMIAGRAILCRSEGRDKHQRILGTCQVGGKNLNQAMVEQGHAVSFGRRYAGEERAAKAAKRGLWSGTFERPQDWRRIHLGSAEG